VRQLRTRGVLDSQTATRFARVLRTSLDVSKRMKIPEIRLLLAPESAEARAAVGFKYAGDDIGRRSKLGGEPDWIQADDTPRCGCSKKMAFYGQLDSIGDEINLADCGMVYVFVCFDCLETKSVLQFY
jgi:hypothetical protein